MGNFVMNLCGSMEDDKAHIEFYDPPRRNPALDLSVLYKEIIY